MAHGHSRNYTTLTDATKAARAGFSEQDLETVLGPLPEFMARAYADAIARWRAEQAFEKGE